MGPIEKRQVRIAVYSLAVLAVLAALFALRAAQPILLPIVIAYIISVLLRPFAAWFDHLGAPQGASAAVISGLFIVGVAAALYVGGKPAIAWFDRLPEVLVEAQEKLEGLEKAWRRVEEVGKQVAELGPQAGETPQVAIRERSWAEAVGSAAQGLLVQFTLVAVLLYFFLATRRSSHRKLLALRRSLRTRLRSARILARVERNVIRYMLTMVAINTGLGVAVGLALGVIGAPTPFIFGALAGVLNFVPYLGPTILNIILLATGFVQGDDLVSTVAPFGVYLTLNFIESNFVTPYLIGVRSRVSPLAIILAIALFTWLWGPGGAVVAIPVLVIIKTLSDSLDTLRPLAIVLSEDVRGPRRPPRRRAVERMRAA